MQEEHEERLIEMVDKEGEIDDDFVKESNEKAEKEAAAGSPERRKLVTPDDRHRRLFGEEHVELKLIAGEPYQKTVLVESPGWYRLCVHGKSTAIEAELELRKSSTYGEV